jgi:aspartate aminotransferase-like enzyme
MDSAIRWGVTQSHPILMIPGPTELPFPVVQAMNQPATIQYDMNFDARVLEPVTLALRTSSRRAGARSSPDRAAPR